MKMAVLKLKAKWSKQPPWWLQQVHVVLAFDKLRIAELYELLDSKRGR